MLVYAFREDSPDHERYRDWLQHAVESEAAYGVSDLVLSGFLRIATHPGIFAAPAPLARALAFVEELREQPHAVTISPGRAHWEIFTRLCRETSAKGNIVPDAYFAALAIESGSEWITTDRDYARFAGLRWRHPLG